MSVAHIIARTQETIMKTKTSVKAGIIRDSGGIKGIF
jgi:hypothetical protein